MASPLDGEQGTHVCSHPRESAFARAKWPQAVVGRFKTINARRHSEAELVEQRDIVVTDQGGIRCDREANADPTSSGLTGRIASHSVQRRAVDKRLAAHER